jgi:hypothetical protein
MRSFRPQKKALSRAFAATLLALAASRLSAAETPASITRAQLEQVPVDSVADPNTIENALIFPDVKTGVFFPNAEILAGDPIAAWIIIKSLAKEPTRGIMADVDLGLTGEKPRVDGTARLQLLRDKNGKLEPLAELKGKIGRTSPRILLPPEGFFVNSGDVANLSQHPLDPGDYCLRFWAEGQRSESRFRIIARPSGAPAPAKRSALSAEKHDMMVLNWMGALQGRPVLKNNLFQWTARNGYMAVRSIEDFRLGIALGVGNGSATRHFSRVSDIPVQDDVVAISCKLKDGSSDKLQITLTPVWPGVGEAATAPATAPAIAATTAPATAPASAPAEAAVPQRRRPVPVAPIPANEYQLPGYPALYLLVENLGPPVGVHIISERQSGGSPIGTRFNVPIVIDAQLPAEWSSRLPFTGKIKLSVVFAAEQVKGGLEQEGDGYDPAAVANYGRSLKPITKRWTSIVKSTPVELTVKPTGQ